MLRSWEVENVSANQRPGWQSCFSDRPEKHKLRRGHVDLASFLPCFVEYRSAVSKEKLKMPQQIIQVPGQPPCFSIGPKNTNFVEDVQILLPVKFRWIPFSGFRDEVENVSVLSQSEAGAASLFFRSARKTRLGRRHWDLASCQVSLN